MVEPRKSWHRTTPYISAHSLLDEGFSLLCYDGTQFKTDTGIIVWAIPVMILPQRYLLHIGHSVNGISSGDLTRSVKEAYALLPEHLALKSACPFRQRLWLLKASSTQRVIKELLGAPVHFGRPHTPDDQAWIEAFIKTLKYHRDAPRSFKLVDDILQWLNRIPEIYNNDPHSSFLLRDPASGTVRPKGGDLKSTETKSCVSSYDALHCLEDRPLWDAPGNPGSSYAACLRSIWLKNSVENQHTGKST